MIGGYLMSPCAAPRVSYRGIWLVVSGVSQKWREILAYWDFMPLDFESSQLMLHMFSYVLFQVRCCQGGIILPPKSQSASSQLDET